MFKDKISLTLTSRRPEKLRNLLTQLQEKMDLYFKEFLILNNDPLLNDEFAKLQKDFPKMKLINAPANYLYKMGFDSAYNLLMKKATAEYSMILFDVDEIEFDEPKFLENFSIQADMYFFEMHMLRGDAWEKKFQLFKNDNLFKWFGLVHENQTFVRNPNILPVEGFKVYHKNAIDNESSNLSKTDDGFLILKPTTAGSDSDNRNLLYESLAWKIVNEQGRHMNPTWFKRHYEINKELIDDYNKRAQEIWK